MNQYQWLLLERDGPVAVLTLNRPEKRNALSIALRDEISACLEELEKDDDIKVVVIAGKGPVFCAGFDLSELANRDPEHVRRNNESSNRYHTRLMNFRKPLIAAVDGPALAGGLDLAALCDIRISSLGATFGHPEVKLGAPVLYSALKDIIGGGPARELCLTGRSIGSREALSLGLVTQVVPADRLLEEAKRLAHSIAEAPLSSLKATKDMIIRASNVVQTWQPEEGDIFGGIKL